MSTETGTRAAPAAATGGRPLVRIDGLRLACASGPVIDGVDLELAAGESVAMAGASGSGKTTLGLAVLGYLRVGINHVGGGVLVDGAPVLPRPPAGLRGGTVGYVGQDPGAALNPFERVGRTIATAAEGKSGAAPERRSDVAAELLSRVGLPEELARRFPDELSGGQQQRVALCVALARRPRLLVLDEPTSSLDVAAVTEIRAELAALRARGIGMLWITHDLAAVAGAVDRLVVLDAGRVIEDQPYRRLVLAPRSPAAAALVAAARPPTADVAPAGEKQHMAPRLRVQRLRAGFAATTVVRDVDLDAFSGRCLAVLGESGVGKTTLARCIAGLHRPAGGRILLDGAPLAPLAKGRETAERAAVQLVPQNPLESLHPRQTVGTAIVRPLRVLRGMRGRAALEAETSRILEQVGLPTAFAGRLPSELSGGQRQRVALARALAARPAVLVCDEITSALDGVTQAEVLDMLVRLCRTERLCIIVITHDPNVVRRIADDIVVLAAGTHRVVTRQALT